MVYNNYLGTVWDTLGESHMISYSFDDALMISSCSYCHCHFGGDTFSDTPRVLIPWESPRRFWTRSASWFPEGNPWISYEYLLDGLFSICGFPKMGGDPCSELFILHSWLGFSNINPPFSGIPHDYGNPH